MIVRGRLVSIGPEYEEAAADLGAPPRDQFFRVLLPLLAPAIVASAAVAFALSIDDFVVTQYLSSDASTTTVSMLLYSSARGAPTPALNAIATVNLRDHAADARPRVPRLPPLRGRRRRRLAGDTGGLMEGEIRLEELCKKFDDVVAVDGIDIDMPPGEFFTLLGPSGCGKTTTLRMIAGFERPTSGRILLDGDDVAQRAPAPAQRQHGVPELRAVPAPRRARRTSRSGSSTTSSARRSARSGSARRSSWCSSAGFAQRKADQLSGGQQQRVALARALVLRPRVLLLDEPLGALDAQLRKNLQVELKALQAELGVTFVFVTHDQEEALTMSDRIAVMNGGRVEQAAPPQEIYEEPRHGLRRRLPGRLEPAHRRRPSAGRRGCTVQVGDRTLRAAQGATDARGEVKVMIRPERIGIEPHGDDGRRTPARHGRARRSSWAAPTRCTCACSAASC